MADKHRELLEYVKANGRACPQPMRWNTLWDMLPSRQRVGGWWEPGPPLILAAWVDTPGLLKHMRFLEHLESSQASKVSLSGHMKGAGKENDDEPFRNRALPRDAGSQEDGTLLWPQEPGRHCHREDG